jgi:hypothetical protein
MLHFAANKSAKKLCNIEGHFDEVSCMDIVGSTLYTGSLDCSVRSWPLTGIVHNQISPCRLTIFTYVDFCRIGHRRVR